ncbi:MAG: Fic family protein [Deltaproteobacteria bacterium]|nr:Fic family protein [Deltaproteobacteria bacterium]
MTYQPPCTISPPVERLLGRICEMVGRLSVSAQGEHLRLRRINRIRTIQGSLAIEGNTLSEEQITAIMDGRRVVAPPREIQEARNAIEVYDRLEQRDLYRETDLLAAHEIMMRSLMDAPGRYRTGGVGVMGRKEVMLNRGERHPLVASSIFHYEFEFIHPFADGNGRMGRLWQSLILARWNSIFAITPVESMVHARQQEYYEAIGQSTNMNDSAPFVEFMLEVIRETLGDMGSDQAADQVSDQVQRLLRLVDQEFVTFRKNYLRPALDAGLLEMKYPENPKHPRQRYRLTSKGRSMKALLGEQ